MMTLLLVFLVALAFVGNLSTGIPFVYVNEIGVTYQPHPYDQQPVVQIVNRQWGYDIKKAGELPVCILTVERLPDVDAPITPAPGSFLIWLGSQYLTPEEFEKTADCASTRE